jgi:hypothetical protein
LRRKRNSAGPLSLQNARDSGLGRRHGGARRGGSPGDGLHGVCFFGRTCYLAPCLGRARARVLLLGGRPSAAASQRSCSPDAQRAARRNGRQEEGARPRPCLQHVKRSYVRGACGFQGHCDNGRFRQRPRSNSASQRRAPAPTAPLLRGPDALLVRSHVGC